MVFKLLLVTLSKYLLRFSIKFKIPLHTIFSKINIIKYGKSIRFTVPIFYNRALFYNLFFFLSIFSLQRNENTNDNLPRTLQSENEYVVPGIPAAMYRMDVSKRNILQVLSYLNMLLILSFSILYFSPLLFLIAMFWISSTLVTFYCPGATIRNFFLNKCKPH